VIAANGLDVSSNIWLSRALARWRTDAGSVHCE